MTGHQSRMASAAIPCSTWERGALLYIPPMTTNTVPSTAIAGRNGGFLLPWQPGQSGNPKGRPPKAITALLKRLDNRDEAEALVRDYLALCHSEDEHIRLEALKDLWARAGLAAQTGQQGNTNINNGVQFVIRDYGGIDPRAV